MIGHCFYFRDEDLIAGTQSNEVGPNFNEAHFFTTMNGVALKAWRTRCKKIGGHENQYAIAMYAREEFMPCIENWERSENFYDSQNFKSSLKKCASLILMRTQTFIQIQSVIFFI